MPQGYSGAPARRYFGLCDEAMLDAQNALARAGTRAPLISMPMPRLLPYTESDAAFNGGMTAGYRSSANIVGNSGAYTAAINGHRLFGRHIHAELQALYTRIGDITESDDYEMPQSGAQVRLVVEKLKLLTPELKELLEKAANVTERQAAAMMGIAGGGFEGLEMQRTAADGFRMENERCMRCQVDDMRNAAEDARAQAIRFEEDANLLRPRLSATRTVRVYDGNYHVRTASFFRYNKGAA